VGEEVNVVMLHKNHVKSFPESKQEDGNHIKVKVKVNVDLYSASS